MAPTETTNTRRAADRARSLTTLMWHVGAFVIIGAFLWVLDIVTGGGVTWAFWITGGWGILLAFHALAYYIQGEDLDDRHHPHEYDAEETHRRMAEHL